MVDQNESKVVLGFGGVEEGKMVLVWQVGNEVAGKRRVEKEDEALWQGFLAGDGEIMFMAVRRFQVKGEERGVSKYRLHGLFMAAAPLGQRILDYEKEEEAIVRATGGIGMDLVVEESGTLQGLGETLARLGGVDVLHISCHGGMKGEGGEGEWVLFFETDEGDEDVVTVERLAGRLGSHYPGLLFLSGCETAQPDGLLSSFAGDMLRLGMGAVAGWCGGAVGVCA